MSLKDLKIAYFLPSTGFGGTELHTFSLIRYLRSEGALVTLIFPVSSGTARVVAECSLYGVEYIDCDISYPGGKQSLLDVCAVHTDLLNDVLLDRCFDFAIVAAPSPVTVFGVLNYLKECLVPSICIFHLVHPASRFSEKEKDFFHRVDYPGLRYVTVGDYTKDVMVDVLGIPSAKISVINNGVDVDSDIARVFTLKKQLGIPEESRIVYTFGRLHSQKSMDTLLEAVPEVLKHAPDVHFVWAGEGDQEADLKARALELGVSDCISFMGFVDAPYSLIPSIDVVAIPTRFESLSVRLLEAMEMGACIVTTSVSYQDRILRNGIDGFICVPDSVEDLSEKIIIALSSQDLRERVGDSAKKRVKEFSYSGMCQQYTNLIRALRSSSVNGTPAHQAYETKPVHYSIESELWGVLLNLDGKVLGGIAESFLLPVSNGSTETIVDFYVGGIKLHSKSWPVVVQDSDALFRLAIEEFLFNEDVEYQPRAWVVENIYQSMCRIYAMSDLWSRILRKFAIRYRSKSPSLSAVLLKFMGGDIASDGFRWSDIATSSIESLRADFFPMEKPHNDLSVCRKKVLFFGAHFVWPPQNGSDRRMTEMVDLYRRAGCDVDLVRIAELSQPNSAPVDVIETRFGCKVIDIKVGDVALKSIKTAYAAGRSGKVDGCISAFFSPDLYRQFNGIVDRLSPDVVHVNYAIYGWLATFCQGRGIVTVLDTHDIVSKRLSIFRAILSASGKSYPDSPGDISLPFLANSCAKPIGFRMNEEELLILNSFDVVLAISPTEYETLSGYVSDGRVVFLPYMPAPDPRAFYPEDGSVAGFGGGINLVNLASLHMVMDISRRMAVLAENFRLSLVGHVGSVSPGWRIFDKKGFVENSSDPYIEWSYSLCPIPLATGQNIKVAEALSRACPVVTFSNIAKDTGVIDGVNGVVVNSFSECFDAVQKLYFDKDYYLSLVRSSYQWLSRDYCKSRSERESVFFSLLEETNEKSF